MPQKRIQVVNSNRPQKAATQAAIQEMVAVLANMQVDTWIQGSCYTYDMTTRRGEVAKLFSGYLTRGIRHFGETGKYTSQAPWNQSAD